MMVESRKSGYVVKIVVNFILLVFAVACLFPFLLVLSISLSNEQDIVQFGYNIIPKHMEMTAYQYVLSNPTQIVDSYLVTILTTVVGTVLSVIMMGMVAYPLSCAEFRSRRGVNFYIFFTMLFSGGLVPSYILVSNYLKMGDTIWALFVPGLISAYHIFIMRTFFQGLPREISESAKIDGANEVMIFFKLILPLSKPVFATVAFMGAMARWNDWYSALLYIQRDSLSTLQYLLYRIMSNTQFLVNSLQNVPAGVQLGKIPAETSRMAMCVIAAGPMLFVFPFFQKYFVKGMTVGAVKG